MAGQIQITPGELVSQVQQMRNLMGQFESSFNSVSKILDTVNTGWSAKLANNFLSKITSMTGACSTVLGLLGNGVDATMAAAGAFETVDSALAQLMYGGVLGAGGSAAGAISAAAQLAAQQLGIDPSLLQGLTAGNVQQLIQMCSDGDFQGIAKILGTGFTGEMQQKIAEIIQEKTGLVVDPGKLIEQFKDGKISEGLFDIAGATLDVIESHGGISLETAAVDMLYQVGKIVTDENGYARTTADLYAGRIQEAFSQGDIVQVAGAGIDYAIDLAPRVLVDGAAKAASHILDNVSKKVIGTSVSEINDMLEGTIGVNPGKIVNQVGSVIGDAWHSAVSEGGIGQAVAGCASSVIKTGGKFLSGIGEGLKKLF